MHQGQIEHASSDSVVRDACEVAEIGSLNVVDRQFARVGAVCRDAEMSAIGSCNVLSVGISCPEDLRWRIGMNGAS